MPLNLTADMTAYQEQGYLVIPEVLGPAEVSFASYIAFASFAAYLVPR